MQFSALYIGEEKYPKYQTPNSASTESNDSSMFEAIEQVCSFWADLWEKSGTGNKNAKWLLNPTR